ncbi:MAG: glycosyltransferase [Acidimicrobiales bacterium]
MRITFVTSVAFGGALESSNLLADRLAARGHEVEMIHGTRGHSMLKTFHRRAVNLSTKLSGTPLEDLSWWAARHLRRSGAERRSGAGVTVVAVDVPENEAMRRLGDGVDVVVGYSISRPAWRQILGRARVAGVPTVLYLREDESLGHLDRPDAADRVVANAEVHARRARDKGYDATTIPSIIDRDRCRAETTRSVALLVNPIADYGVDVVLSLAEVLPEVRFVLQESWPLTGENLEVLEARCRELPNLELRRFTSRIADVYRDAKVLLVPYGDDNRPRVVAEAQTNGIPVLGADRPGIAEVAGAGGVLVDPASGLDVWERELRRLWTDAAHYEELSRLARQNSVAAERAEDALVDRFEEMVTELVGATSP